MGREKHGVDLSCIGVLLDEEMTAVVVMWGKMLVIAEKHVENESVYKPPGRFQAIANGTALCNWWMVSGSGLEQEQSG
jgi:hypothetical protein